MTTLTLSALKDAKSTTGLLGRAGLSPEACVEKGKLFEKLAVALSESGAALDEPVVACYVPGRIEVLGKHTDYAGGRSLLAAPERGFCVVAQARTDQTIRMRNLDGDLSVSFPFDKTLSPTVGHWSNYPMTAARRLAQNFPGDLQGADIVFTSDLPAASGMSSSSALIVATFLVLIDINCIDQRELFKQHISGREDLAAYLGCVENGQSFGSLVGDRGVGTFGGSEDHVAMLCCEAGTLRQYAYCPVRFERAIPFPDDYTFAIASSGVVAEKTGTALEKYNRLSQLTSEILAIWNRMTDREDPHLAAALASSPDAAERLRRYLSMEPLSDFTSLELSERLEHFLNESEEILPGIPKRLVCIGLDKFSKLVARSQATGARLLQNQVPETIFLAENACTLGATAASAFGAGFGGSVWAMIPIDSASVFLDRWRDAYHRAFPEWREASEFFTTRPGPGAILLGK